MDTKLRRYRGSLVTNGGCIIAFGLWSALKFVITFITDSDLFNYEINDHAEGSEYALILKILTIIFVASIIAFILYIHIYIGRSSYREGLSEKTGSFYLVITFIVAVIVLFEMVLYLVPRDNIEENFISLLAAFFIDLTKELLLVDTLYVAVMSRHIAKKIAK